MEHDGTAPRQAPPKPLPEKTRLRLNPERQIFVAVTVQRRNRVYDSYDAAYGTRGGLKEGVVHR